MKVTFFSMSPRVKEPSSRPFPEFRKQQGVSVSTYLPGVASVMHAPCPSKEDDEDGPKGERQTHTLLKHRVGVCSHPTHSPLAGVPLKVPHPLEYLFKGHNKCVAK